eukprot:TRINITY_DN6033_c0_g2_i1.p1 TRINITY_DN6033_c0_g2~~TRINITY_DN6033_c0_g2_i1.p1  ORF type:complete len:289 (+),score=92.85 TRINITY_DN6033_c0_g2_i1:92-958(+)
MVYSDRTNDFFAYCKKQNETKKIKLKKPSGFQLKTTFSIAANNIAKNLKDTFELLDNLRKLVEVPKLFNDPVEEIQKLTYIIKKNITNTSRLLEGLEDITNKKNKQTEKHSIFVVNSLKSDFSIITKEFREILVLRSENCEKQKKQRSQLVGGFNNFSNSNNWYAQPEQLDTSNNDVEIIIGDNQQQQQTLFKPQKYNGKERLQEAQQIETVFHDLQDIMQQMTVYVAQQGEQIERIDDNVENTLHYVEGAQNALLQTLQHASSNRGLILKMFASLAVFIVVFFIFFV